MVRFVGRNILTGVVTILPVVLTLYILYWLAVSAESVLGGMIRWILPEGLYWPGMGLAAGLAVVFVVGLLMHTDMVQRIFARGEELFYHMPIVKSVYRAIRDFIDYFSPAAKAEFKQVVAVTIGKTGMEVIGFVTQPVPERLPEDFRGEDSVLVYLPLSYMIGGYAVLTPRSAVRPVNMTLEEAMRFTLTAGVTAKQAPPGVTP
ncbi:MAG: hypothetical protein C0617_02025 [Desulfuromonas sp.]|uniref:DUF502 domain-containing protein n=1 Tax=Desulfuromonas sp. TaxID=892 RepID=UPI000CA7C020|nr:DUF502 domain-containing protein [Desulfuromonas sp.]PLX86160.1 MAG: hypothetical protein C0617_02025 [Desulfuromonas sp.]